MVDDNTQADPTGPEDWFVIRTKPGGTARACQNLARQGFAVFDPRLRRTLRQGARLVTRTEPLFPGYLFVTFDPAAPDWGRIRNTYGVATLLMTARQRPAPLPSGFVADLRARLDAEGCLLPDAGLAPGDAVRITAGPFTESIGRIAALDGAGRVAVLLELMGRQVQVSLGRGDLTRHD